MADRAELPIPTLPSRDVPMAVAPGRDFAVPNPMGLPVVPGNFVGGEASPPTGLAAAEPMGMEAAIANYLNYTGGQWPAAGIPGVPRPADLTPPMLRAPTVTSPELNPKPDGPPKPEALTNGEPWGDPSNVEGSSPLAPTAPGQLIGGMAPEMWLKKYRGEA